MPFIPDLRHNRSRESCGEVDHTLRKAFLFTWLYNCIAVWRQKTPHEARANRGFLYIYIYIYIASQKYVDVEMKETKCRSGEMERVIHSLFPVECWNSQMRGFENVTSGFWLDYHASSHFSLTWWIRLHGRSEDGMIWKWLISSYVTWLVQFLKPVVNPAPFSWGTDLRFLLFLIWPLLLLRSWLFLPLITSRPIRKAIAASRRPSKNLL